jgi:hypothetical protein
MKAARFKPGEAVPENGVYRAEHKAHRLVHMATLAAQSLFPRCKECGNAVAYYFVRWVRSRNVLPLRSGILQEYVPPGTVGFASRKQNKLGRSKIGQSKISP